MGQFGTVEMKKTTITLIRDRKWINKENFQFNRNCSRFVMELNTRRHYNGNENRGQKLLY